MHQTASRLPAVPASCSTASSAAMFAWMSETMRMRMKGSIPKARSYNGDVNVSNLGEFGLIDRLARIAGNDHADLILGIGDDDAVWRAGQQFLLATTDTLVEGVHFTPGAERWADPGWKALAVSVSDIAAMGGRPLFALVTLAVPPHMQTKAIESLYEGLSECAREHGVAVAGGYVVRADQFSITVALVGEAQQAGGKPLL